MTVLIDKRVCVRADGLVGQQHVERKRGRPWRSLINSDNPRLDCHLQLIGLATKLTFTHRPMKSVEGDMFIIRVNSMIKNRDDDQIQAGKAANHLFLTEAKRQR